MRDIMLEYECANMVLICYVDSRAALSGLPELTRAFGAGKISELTDDNLEAFFIALVWYMSLNVDNFNPQFKD